MWKQRKDRFSHRTIWEGKAGKYLFIIGISSLSNPPKLRLIARFPGKPTVEKVFDPGQTDTAKKEAQKILQNDFTNTK
jgi:hypothetical protein